MEGRSPLRQAGATRPRPPRAGIWIYAAILGLALATVAVLQYRWTGEVSRLERDRLARATAGSLQRFVLEFDGEIADLAAAFLGAESADLHDAWLSWRDGSRHPDLLQEVWIDDPQAAGMQRLDLESGLLKAAALPPDLAFEPDRARAEMRRWPPVTVSARPPLVVLRAPPRFAPQDLAQGPSPAPARPSTVLLRLDTEALRRAVLPAIAESTFAELGLDHDLWVVDEQDGTVLWASRADAAVPASAPRAPLGRLGGLPDRHAAARHFLHEPAPDASRRHERRRVWPRQGFDGTAGSDAAPRLARRDAPPTAAPWVLVAQHPAGSLDRAVANLRARNLAVSASVLALLGASGGLLLLAARRAEEAARRQSEWVAGLTHELHTPLAALSAAGENLADGLITTPEKVREYGELIRREGTRLEKLVGQALALARLEGPRRSAPAAVAVSLHEIVERAVSQRELERRRHDGTIVVELAPDLPSVLGDSESLERVVGNLLDNALKHGRGRVWVLGTRSREQGSATNVELVVADDGPGVDTKERDAIFEPYVRGGAARARGVAGAGLGLHLVRRLVEEAGGVVELLSQDAVALPRDANGAAFRVTFPAAPSVAPERA